MITEQETKILELFLKKGNFTQVPNELLEFLAKLNLTSTELRICLFLIRELTGWDYEYKPISIFDFSVGVSASERSVKDALKNLVSEKILLKQKVPGYRTPCYGFNKELIGRVTITEPRTVFVDGSNVIDLQTFKLTKVRESAHSKCETSHFQDAKVRTQKTQEQATRAASQTPKYTQTHGNTLSEKNSSNLDWEKVKSKLLIQFPNDAVRLERTYKQILARGFEQNGREPRHIINLPRWLLVSYKDIRANYAHLDQRKEA